MIGTFRVTTLKAIMSATLNIVLFEPEIPNNTGSIIRLCANMGATLHLIKPYGFEITDKRLRRAGLDYKDLMCMVEYDDFDDYLDKANPSRVFVVSSKVQTSYADVSYIKGDSFLFGRETSGLPDAIRNQFEGITLPMQENSRSLNLANCASIVAYEAWRQLNFCKL